jgi:hypothetical protein
MYSILKQVIEERGYVLGEMLERINLFSARGKITVDEQEELIELARANARAEDEVDLYAKVVELEQLIKELTAEVELLKQAGEEPVEPEEPTDPEEPEEPVLYPEFVAGKWYYAGDVCSENGENFVCVAPDKQVCTWSPSQYPVYWEKVTE